MRIGIAPNELWPLVTAAKAPSPAAPSIRARAWPTWSVPVLPHCTGTVVPMRPRALISTMIWRGKAASCSHLAEFGTSRSCADLRALFLDQDLFLAEAHPSR